MAEKKLKGKLKEKKQQIYTLITPYKDWFVQILFCWKIEYVNLGLLILLFYFDIGITLLQFIERNSGSVSKSMLLILFDLLPPLFEITRISF